MKAAIIAALVAALVSAAAATATTSGLITGKQIKNCSIGTVDLSARRRSKPFAVSVVLAGSPVYQVQRDRQVHQEPTGDLILPMSTS
jgi:hypothetical protein